MNPLSVENAHIAELTEVIVTGFDKGLPKPKKGLYPFCKYQKFQIVQGESLKADKISCNT